MRVLQTWARGDGGVEHKEASLSLADAQWCGRHLKRHYLDPEPLVVTKTRCRYIHMYIYHVYMKICIYVGIEQAMPPEAGAGTLTMP